MFGQPLVHLESNRSKFFLNPLIPDQPTKNFAWFHDAVTFNHYLLKLFIEFSGFCRDMTYICRVFIVPDVVSIWRIDKDQVNAIIREWNFSCVILYDLWPSRNHVIYNTFS